MKIRYPDFGPIVLECFAEIDRKFLKYKNMWTTKDVKKWWTHRLQNEISELIKCQTVEEEQRKYINIINLAAMAREMRKPHKHVYEMIHNSKYVTISECKSCREIVQFAYRGKEYNVRVNDDGA